METSATQIAPPIRFRMWPRWPSSRITWSWLHVDRTGLLKRSSHRTLTGEFRPHRPQLRQVWKSKLPRDYCDENSKLNKHTGIQEDTCFFVSVIDIIFFSCKSNLYRNFLIKMRLFWSTFGYKRLPIASKRMQLQRANASSASSTEPTTWLIQGASRGMKMSNPM